MAIIHSRTFDIYTTTPNQEVLKESFECDDLIAPIIRALNLKGYKTAFCCAGHPYRCENNYFLSAEEKPSLETVPIKGTYSIKEVSFEDLPEDNQQYFSNRTGKIFEGWYTVFESAYISFAPGCAPSFDSLLEKNPNGYYAGEEDYLMIVLPEDFDNPYAFFSEQLLRMQELMEWVQALPKNN